MDRFVVTRATVLGGVALLLGACGGQELARIPAVPIADTGAHLEIVHTGNSAQRSEEPTSCPAAVTELLRAGAPPASAPVPRPVGLALLEEAGREVASLHLDLPVPVVRQPADADSRCLLMVEVESTGSDRRELARETIWSERPASVVRRPNPEYEAVRRELTRLADRLDREDREQARNLRRLSPTGNAWVDALGLVGGLVLGGIGSFARDREFSEARAKLESLPRWIEETRFEPYRVTVVDTELVRRATVRLGLVDSESRRFWAVTVPVARTDRLRVALDLHPSDRSRVQGNHGLLGPEDLESLERALPPLVLSELLPHLATSVAHDAGRPGGPAEVRTAWAETQAQRLAGSLSSPATTPKEPVAERGPSIASSAPTGAETGTAKRGAERAGFATRSTRRDRKLPTGTELGSGSASRLFVNANGPASAVPISSVANGQPTAIQPGVSSDGWTIPAELAAALVQVEGSGGRVHGFYVGPDKILTLTRAFGESSLVRVETGDGFVTWGVIERERPGSELVLVHVPRRGRYLSVGEPGSSSPSGPLPEPGLPILRDGRVVAVSLDPLEGRAAGSAELARILSEPAHR